MDRFDGFAITIDGPEQIHNKRRKYNSGNGFKVIIESIRALSDSGLSLTNAIGYIAKWGGRGLVALGAYQEAKDHYEKHRDVGRTISYSAVATGSEHVAGTIGASIGGSIAVGLGTVSTGLIATFAAPLVGAVVVGTLASVAVTALYNNVKPFRDAVDWIGDGVNTIGNAFSNSLDSIQGVFSW